MRNKTSSRNKQHSIFASFHPLLRSTYRRHTHTTDSLKSTLAMQQCISKNPVLRGVSDRIMLNKQGTNRNTHTKKHVPVYRNFIASISCLNKVLFYQRNRDLFLHPSCGFETYTTTCKLQLMCSPGQTDCSHAGQ